MKLAVSFIRACFNCSITFNYLTGYRKTSLSFSSVFLLSIKYISLMCWLASVKGIWNLSKTSPHTALTGNFSEQQIHLTVTASDVLCVKILIGRKVLWTHRTAVFVLIYSSMPCQWKLSTICLCTTREMSNFTNLTLTIKTILWGETIFSKR